MKEYQLILKLSGLKESFLNSDGKGMTCNKESHQEIICIRQLHGVFKDDINQKFDDIDPHWEACESDNDMPVEHDTKMGDNFLMKNIDRDKGNLQTEKRGTLKNQ